jgi:hypothetical protein
MNLKTFVKFLLTSRVTIHEGFRRTIRLSKYKKPQVLICIDQTTIAGKLRSSDHSPRELLMSNAGQFRILTKRKELNLSQL